MSDHPTPLPSYVRWTLFAGIVIAIISVGAAFVVVWFARGEILSLSSQLAGTADGYGALVPDKALVNERSEIRSLLVASTIVSYDQSLRTAALALATAILAIGFALFVMEVESAYKASGRVASGQAFKIEASSPGLLCFVMATILIVVVMARGVSIEHLTKADSQSASASSAPHNPADSAVQRNSDPGASQ
jgi:hypothetical protein